MIKRVKGNYKVVETNNITALRTGDMIAQTPLKQAGVYANKDVAENGYVLFLDIDGELKAPADATLKNVPILHYTEELFTGRHTTLDAFALEFVDEVAYPRGLILTIGDVFTTNNADVFEDGLYVIADDGSFKKGTDEADTFLFYGVKTTTPNGEEDAVELTFLGKGGVA